MDHFHGCIGSSFIAFFGLVHVFPDRPRSRKYGFRSSREMDSSASTPAAWCVCCPQITTTRSDFRISFLTSCFPLAVERLRHGAVDECKGRLGSLRLGDEIAGQISVVVVVEADEDALSGQALVPFPPDDAVAVDRISLAGATRARKRELPTVLGADPDADAGRSLLLSADTVTAAGARKVSAPRSECRCGSAAPGA